MIFEVLEQSLRQPNRVIPLDALLGNCEGSRMPDVTAARLTPAIAQRLVEVCPTGAFSLGESGGQLCLKLSYTECVGCGKCEEHGVGAVVTAQRFTWCGLPKGNAVRLWNIESHSEITPARPNPEI